MFDVRLRLFAPDGSKGRVLATSTMSASIQESDVAGLSFAVSERVAGRLQVPFVVGVEFTTGGPYVQPRNGLFIVTEEGLDSADQSKTVTFTGEAYVPWLMLGMHQRMVEYPGAKRVAKTHEWANATPGRVMRSLIDHGQSVDGWATMLTCDFTATADSAGASWTAAERWSPTFQDLFTSVREIFDAHVENGLIDWWAEGTTLRVFRPGAGVILPNVKLGGPGFSRMPMKQAFQGQFNYLTVIADDGGRYYTNPGAETKFGRYHQTMTMAGVKLADADRLVQPFLEEGRTLRRELSYEWQPVGKLPVPWVDFEVGDGVQVRGRDGWTEQRVLGVTVVKSDTGLTVRATVGSKLLNRLKRVVRKVEGGTSGGIQGGTGVTVPVVPPTPAGAPEAPGAVRVESNTAVWLEDGSALTAVVVAWDEVTQDVNDSAVDGVTYEVWARTGPTERARLTATDGLSFRIEGWEPGVPRYVSVRAVDRAGVASVFSDEIAVVPVAPASIVPKAPTGLAVASNTGVFQDDNTAVATVVVSWNAVTMSLDDQPVDIREYEVRVGLSTFRVTGLSGEFTVPSGKHATVRVVACTTLGVWGDPSAVLGVVGAVPSAAVAAPSDPVVEAGMGGVAASWDGQLVSGPVPAGFGRVVMEANIDGAGWKPVGSPLSAAGGAPISAVAGTTVAVRLTSYDALGRVGGTSNVVTGVASGIPLSQIPGLEGAIDDIRHTSDGKNRIYLSTGEPVGDQTNLAADPSFETAGDEVEVWRSALRNPLGRQGSAWTTSGSDTVTQEVAVTGWPTPVAVQATGTITSFFARTYAHGLIDGVTPGLPYHARVVAESDTAGFMYINLIVRNASGGTVREVHFTSEGRTVAAGERFDVTVPFTPEPGEVRVDVGIRLGTSSIPVTTGTRVTLTGVAALGLSSRAPLFDGEFSEDDDYTPSWSDAPRNSAAVLTGREVSRSYNGVSVRSTKWKSTGDHSLRLFANQSGNTFSYLGEMDRRPVLEPGETYTLQAKVYVPEPLDAPGNAADIRFAHQSGGALIGPNGAVPNEAGVHTVTVVATMPNPLPDHSVNVRLYNRSNMLGESVWVDDLMIVKGVYDGPFVQPFAPGDLWFRLDPAEASVVQILVWNGTTWAPQVLYAEDIFAAGSITGALVRANTLEVNHVSPTFGDDLIISANESVQIIVGTLDTQADQIAGVESELGVVEGVAWDAADDAAAARATADGAAAAAGNAQASADDVDARLDQHQTYYRFGTQGLSIGDPASAAELRLKPERIEMTQNNVVVSYWEGGVFVADEARLQSAQVGNHQFMAYGSGRTIVRVL